MRWFPSHLQNSIFSVSVIYAIRVKFFLFSVIFYLQSCDTIEENLEVKTVYKPTTVKLLAYHLPVFAI